MVKAENKQLQSLSFNSWDQLDHSCLSIFIKLYVKMMLRIPRMEYVINKENRNKKNAYTQNQKRLKIFGHIMRKEGSENVTLTGHNESK